MTQQPQAKTLDELLAAAQPKYLTTDERDEMVLQRAEFYVLSVEGPTQGQFGERWEVGIVVNGMERILSMPVNDARQDLMLGLKDLCQQQGQQGPLVLRSAKTRYPNPFYYFARPVASAQMTLAESKGASAAR